jgi:uncharacterized protein YacL
MWKTLKYPLAALFALLLGFIGLSLVFSDLNQGESLATRILTAALFFSISGVGIGLLIPKAWMVSALVAWGAILMGGFITLTALRKYGSSAFGTEEPPYISSGLIVLILPVTVSLIGGYFGKQIRHTKAKTEDI